MSMYGGLTFDAYDFARLGGDRYSTAPIRDEMVWISEARRVANYLQRFYATDALLQAFVNVYIELTLGERGLRLKSRYQARIDSTFDEEERKVQGLIDKLNARTYEGTVVDAGDALTRREVEAAVITNSLINTDGIAVKVVLGKDQVQPGELRTKWRIVNPARVMNPAGIQDWTKPKGRVKGVRMSDVPSDSVIWQGIEVDKVHHRPRAIWINTNKDNTWGVGKDDTFVRAPYHDDSGNKLVIHRFFPLRPGQLRGYPLYAPFLFTLLQLQGVNEAYIVGKRVQAMNPMFLSGTDPQQAAALGAVGSSDDASTVMKPGLLTYLGEDGSVEFGNVEFKGDDYSKFVEVQARTLGASIGIPWQYVLNHVSGISMASGRIYIDRAYRKGRQFQNDHIETVTAPMDASYNQEGIARGVLPIRSVRNASVGLYMRPRSASLDPNKDALRVREMITQGVAPDTAFADVYGLDFESQMVVWNRNKKFAAQFGFELPTSDNGMALAVATAAPEEPEKPEEGEEGEGDE